MKKHNFNINKWLFVFYFLIFNFYLSSCKKTETYSSASIADYNPSQTGKYITYKLDSLIYLSFGTRDTTVSYQVKYLTDSLITDNLGRPAYRIFRFIRKDENNSWAPDATFVSVNTGNNLEFIENNLRYIKLQMPIKDGVTWKGNSYIDTYSANSLLRYLDNWDYVYSNVGGADVVGSFNLDNTLTINQRDEIIGIPDDPGSYSEVNFSQEKYSKGIGMVYRKFFHSEYQPNNGGYFADGSYGVTYTMIDHN
ncbi:MAG: hypothetical protein WCH52_00285 [Bacteroidota bacterium]